jgi:protein-S-isoprenylcysteine O-methyltransferase Ste14
VAVPISLTKKAFEASAKFLIALAILLFLSAWSLTYWEGWLLLAVFSLAVIFITAYFLRRDPALIERRMQAGAVAEKQKMQKIIQSIASVCFVALFVLSGIDHHLGWSHVPLVAIWVGDAMVAAGFLIVFVVFRENSFASSTIEVAEGQRVVSTGPYHVVRHPMYSGAVVLLVGIPLALGSAYGLLICIPMIATLVWRLVDEEKFLSNNLAGYREYRAQTRHRLVPGIY